MSPSASKVAAGFLSLAVVLGAAAWRVQSEAAGALERAVAAAEEEVPESEEPPTSLQEYRDVVAALQESIAVRGRIDDLLTRVEGVLEVLGRRQEQASSVTAEADGRLDEIARALGGAGRAAELSVGRLGELGGRLGVTARLARQIAEELEELDRSLGPSAGAQP